MLDMRHMQAYAFSDLSFWVTRCCVSRAAKHLFLFFYFLFFYFWCVCVGWGDQCTVKPIKMEASSEVSLPNRIERTTPDPWIPAQMTNSFCHPSAVASRRRICCKRSSLIRRKEGGNSCFEEKLIKTRVT